MPDRDRLRALPSVDRLATSVARAELADRRAELLAGARDEADLVERARERLRPAPRRVLNATGVVVHTNLGRAPLAAAARAAVAARRRGLRDLELDLARRRARLAPRARRRDPARAHRRRGGPGRQQLRGAVLLAAAALAGAGRELVVSRGQLIEIGGSFRIPDVVAQAGARLVEVGTTNRTRLADYGAALSDRDRCDPPRAPVELPHRRLRRGGRDRVALLARRAGDRRRRLRACSPTTCGAGRRAPRAPLGPRGRRARLLLRRQAPRRPAGRDHRRHARGGRACARHPLARALRIDKLSLAALRGDARALPRPRAGARGDPGPGDARRGADRARGAGRARSPGRRAASGRRRRQGRRRGAAVARAARPGSRPRRGAGACRAAARAAIRRSSGAIKDGPPAARPAHADRRRGRRGRAPRCGAARRERARR